jgi:hypothetical protein
MLQKHAKRAVFLRVFRTGVEMLSMMVSTKEIMSLWGLQLRCFKNMHELAS